MIKNYDPWDRDEKIPIEEFIRQRNERRSLLEERTLAMLKHCKGLSVEEVKTVTDRVNVRVRAEVFYPTA